MPVRNLQPANLSRTLSRWAGVSSVLVLGAAALQSAGADTRAALPPMVGDYKLARPAQIYTPATLENHIDGEAESVKHYGFKECAYGEYAPKGQGNPLEKYMAISGPDGAASPTGTYNPNPNP
jgi:hypothetical protein